MLSLLRVPRARDRPLSMFLWTCSSRAYRRKTPRRCAPIAGPLRPRLTLNSVRDVAKILGSASQPVIMAGTGAYWARAEHALDGAARASQAPVFLNGMARGMLGRNHPFQVFGNRREALKAADVVLLLGADFDFRLGFGQAGLVHDDAVIIQVDPDPSRIGRNRGVTIGVTADIRQFLSCLLAEDFYFWPIGAAGLDTVIARQGCSPV